MWATKKDHKKKKRSTSVAEARLLEDGDGDENTNAQQQQDGDKAERPAAVAASSPSRRLHYLDNLKSGLTAIVVGHHITCCFMSKSFYVGVGYNRSNWLVVPGSIFCMLNQSYFMALFFFISGYFTPASFDRKGRVRFLRDKFKRLGQPFAFYSIVLGPTLGMFLQRVMMRPTPHKYTYGADPGPCWFLGWLLLFNLVFALVDVDAKAVTWPRPRSVPRLGLLGLGLGILQFGVVGLVGSQFAMMPITVGSLPFDIVAFFGGVAARRNGWLKEDVTTRELLLATCGVHVFGGIIAGVITWAFVSNYAGGLFFPPATPAAAAAAAAPLVNGTTTAAAGAAGAGGTMAQLVLYLIACLTCGVFCLLFFVVAIGVCQRKCNHSSNVTRFFSGSAYAVYVIHPWVVLPVFWSLLLILRAADTSETTVAFPPSSTFSSTELGPGIILGGFLYVLVLSNLVVWPLGWALKQLPGLRWVL